MFVCLPFFFPFPGMAFICHTYRSIDCTGMRTCDAGIFVSFFLSAFVISTKNINLLSSQICIVDSLPHIFIEEEVHSNARTHTHTAMACKQLKAVTKIRGNPNWQTTLVGFNDCNSFVNFLWSSLVFSSVCLFVWFQIN